MEYVCLVHSLKFKCPRYAHNLIVVETWVFFQLCVLIQVLIRILIFIADGLVQSMGSAQLNSLEHLFISQG